MRHLALLFAGLLPAVLPAQEPSVVDYLKAHKQDASMEARAGLYKALPGKKDEVYKGTEEQNLTLLAALLAKDGEANKAAKTCCEELKKVKVARAPASDTHVQEYYSFPRWAPVKGIGVHASFGVLLSVDVRAGKIEDQQIAVAINSAAAQLAKLEVAGTVIVSVDGKETRFALQEAWFDTLGPAGDKTLYRYGQKGQSVAIPKDAAVTARFEVFLTIASATGRSPIMPSASGELRVQAGSKAEKK